MTPEQGGEFEWFTAPAQRNIFRYFNGSEMTAADPLAIQEALVGFPDFDLDNDLSLLKLETPEAAKEQSVAAARVVAAVRHAFKVPEFKEEAEGRTVGLTRAECLALLGNFLRYLSWLKKSTSPSQTSPPPTAGSDGPTPTSSSSDSSSTGTEPSSAPA